MVCLPDTGYAVLENKQWLFGGVERGSIQCFLVEVPNRTQVTLHEIVLKYFLLAILIVYDCWKARDTLSRL
jgi:hypothetical protein